MVVEQSRHLEKNVILTTDNLSEYIPNGSKTEKQKQTIKALEKKCELFSFEF